MPSISPRPWGVSDGKSSSPPWDPPPKPQPGAVTGTQQTPPQSSLGDPLQGTWPALFESGKVLRTKKRLEEPSQIQDQGHDDKWQNGIPGLVLEQKMGTSAEISDLINL